MASVVAAKNAMKPTLTKTIDMPASPRSRELMRTPMTARPLLGRARLRELRLVRRFGGPHLFSGLVELGLLLLLELRLARRFLRRLPIGFGLAAALVGVTLGLLPRELVLPLLLFRVESRLFGRGLRHRTCLGDLALRRSLLLALQRAALAGDDGAGRSRAHRGAVRPGAS